MWFKWYVDILINMQAFILIWFLEQYLFSYLISNGCHFTVAINTLSLLCDLCGSEEYHQGKNVSSLFVLVSIIWMMNIEIWGTVIEIS